MECGIGWFLGWFNATMSLVSFRSPLSRRIVRQCNLPLPYSLQLITALLTHHVFWCDLCIWACAEGVLVVQFFMPEIFPMGMDDIYGLAEQLGIWLAFWLLFYSGSSGLKWTSVCRFTSVLNFFVVYYLKRISESPDPVLVKDWNAAFCLSSILTRSAVPALRKRADNKS